MSTKKSSSAAKKSKKSTSSAPAVDPKSVEIPLGDPDDFDDDDEASLEPEPVSRERPTPVSGPRRVLIVEPDEARRKLMVAIACELMPGSSVQEAEDEDEAEVALEEDEFEMAIVDLQVPGFSNSEFVRTVNNNESTILVALSLNNLEPGDEKNKSKIDPLRKMFE